MAFQTTTSEHAVLHPGVAYPSSPCLQVLSPPDAYHAKLFGRSPPGIAKDSNVCHVCGDRASGRHYGVISCEGCKSFFKRSIRTNVHYSCRYNYQACPINVQTRSRCQYCRLQKCFLVGMRKDGIKREGLVVPSPTMLSPDHIMNAYKLQTPQVYQSSYFISTLLQANSFAKCREPLGFLTPVSFPVQSDSVGDLSVGVKILKYIVEWAKCIPLFTDLSKSDQEKILESSWLELFVLVATQYRLFPLWSKWAMYSCQGDSEEQNKMLRYIESVVEKYRLMDCDYVEIECLKAIVLYNADCSGLTNNSTVEQLKEGTLASLDDYIRSRYPNRTSRFGCLLLHLPGLRYLKSQVTEDFIFPELTKNPEFISRFIKDTLALSLPSRIPSHFVNYGMLPR